MDDHVVDYVALARAAARQWREANGIPLDADLSALPSLNSRQQETEKDAPGDIETLARECDAKQAIEAKEVERVERGSSPLSYAFPWPDAIPGLGHRTIGPFDCCTHCDRWSWARYGSVVLCLSCARAARP
jgi:hypothetical protein